jgi:hypothetical protein
MCLETRGQIVFWDVKQWKDAMYVYSFNQKVFQNLKKIN